MVFILELNYGRLWQAALLLLGIHLSKLPKYLSAKLTVYADVLSIESCLVAPMFRFSLDTFFDLLWRALIALCRKVRVRVF